MVSPMKGTGKMAKSNGLQKGPTTYSAIWVCFAIGFAMHSDGSWHDQLIGEFGTLVDDFTDQGDIIPRGIRTFNLKGRMKQPESKLKD